MSHPVCYNLLMKMKTDYRDREETITAPDGKEYPIRDNEQKIMKIENTEVKVGDEVRVGMELMIVDEVTEFNTVIVIDQDGGELELTENEIDIYQENPYD